MPYAEKASKPQTLASLIGDGVSICDRLADIDHRINKLAEQLHGPAPNEVAGEKPDMRPSIRRNIDKALDLMDRVESALTRIESRL